MVNKDVMSLWWHQWRWPMSTRARCLAVYHCARCPATWRRTAPPSRRSAASIVRGCWTFSRVSTSTWRFTAVSHLPITSSDLTASSHLSFTTTIERRCCPDAHRPGSVVYYRASVEPEGFVSSSQGFRRWPMKYKTTAKIVQKHCSKFFTFIFGVLLHFLTALNNIWFK